MDYAPHKVQGTTMRKIVEMWINRFPSMTPPTHNNTNTTHSNTYGNTTKTHPAEWPELRWPHSPLLSWRRAPLAWPMLPVRCSGMRCRIDKKVQVYHEQLKGYILLDQIETSRALKINTHIRHKQMDSLMPATLTQAHLGDVQPLGLDAHLRHVLPYGRGVDSLHHAVRLVQLACW